MEALKFTLSGNSAFFKDNVINTIYLTYGNIHRVALLGMFGAILGYSGYGKQNSTYPEFYEKLKDIKISIVSNGENGYFNKKLQTFNNSVGYANLVKDEKKGISKKGGNLIVKQFWLENPSWDIYILLDCDEAEKLAKYIKNKKAIYLPYLGSNDHLANITDVEIVNIVEKVSLKNESIEISSMVKANDIIYCNIDEDDLDEEESDDAKFDYNNSEYLPVALSKKLNQYIKEKITITNMSVKLLKESYYKMEDKNIVFY
ncbi:type I-B CRISPR-associated protein Cas5b [Fusobacterium simiae]|uniref:Type I-B CRISPR-associated protein Cas5b n=1 Tax=Fusobacterium simiae TaxID=855 RepID=A0ABT4DLQ0_FUSSI|nr:MULTISPECIES: type I-B CRISPR-associated protein Cas5b [Fusobacterium]MCY7008451.1 type I-B CRISPR-associated protein Cas5b [Fusobacterium simiae]